MNENPTKYVTQDLFETTNKTIFEKFREHDQHLERIEDSITGMRNEVSQGFRQLTGAIGDHKVADMKGKSSTVFLFFGAFATLFGAVVYFGELKEEVITEKITAHEEKTILSEKILDEKINIAKLETELLFYKNK